MLFGAHLSVSSGYESTVRYALDVGCECLQVFGKSPRQWKGRPIDAEAAAQFVASREETGMGPLFTHTAYLINLSTDDEELRSRSVVALADEIARGRLLGATGVVTHVGNDPAADPAAAATRTADSISRAFELAGLDGTTRLLLENTAGAGRSYGSTFEQMGWVIDALSPDNRQMVGVCLDTCHAHAFGTDLGSPQAWDALLDTIDMTCGADALGLVHANDCKFERGSRKDRHAWIGDGFLGNEAFAAMVCVPRLRSVCAVTEMPGDVPDKDVENIARLKRLRDECERA